MLCGCVALARVLRYKKHQCSVPLGHLPVAPAPLRHLPSSHLAPPWKIMAKNYREIWENVTNATEETKAIRALAEILADKEGRAFASRLERQDAEVCIEILDHVSRDQCLFLSPAA